MKLVMTKDEIKNATSIWPANAKAPLDRDQQIFLMTTAKERHAARILRWETEMKEQN
jgi:hypothetical protein